MEHLNKIQTERKGFDQPKRPVFRMKRRKAWVCSSELTQNLDSWKKGRWERFTAAELHQMH